MRHFNGSQRNQQLEGHRSEDGGQWKHQQLVLSTCQSHCWWKAGPDAQRLWVDAWIGLNQKHAAATNSVISNASQIDQASSFLEWGCIIASLWISDNYIGKFDWFYEKTAMHNRDIKKAYGWNHCKQQKILVHHLPLEKWKGSWFSRFRWTATIMQGRLLNLEENFWCCFLTGTNSKTRQT